MSSLIPSSWGPSSKWITLGFGSLIVLGGSYYIYSRYITHNKQPISTFGPTSSTSLTNSNLSLHTVTDDEFIQAVERVKSDTRKKLSNQIKLRLYGLYKQSTVGSIYTQSPSIERPSLIDMMNTAKYNAWEECNTLTKEEAKAVYVNLVHELWKDTLASSSSSSSHPNDEQKNSNNTQDKDDDDDNENMIRGYSSRPVIPKGPPKEELANDFHYLCSEGNLDQVTNWIKKQPQQNSIPYNIPNEYGETPLHCAADAGHENIIQYLLQAGSDSNSIEPESGQTPLHYACNQGHLSCIQLLITQGKANIRIKDNDGHIPYDLVPEEIQEQVKPWFNYA